MGQHLVVAGDSWTFGSEIVDPKLAGKFKEWDSANNTFRIPRIWPISLYLILLLVMIEF
jgi:hypothetical protein